MTIDNQWYLIKPRELVFKLPVTQSKEVDYIPLDPVPEEEEEEEEYLGDDDSPLIRRRSKVKKREIVEEEISSGEDLLPRKKYRGDKPKHVTLEERIANTVIEAVVPLVREFNTKLDAQERELQSLKRDIQRLSSTVEYAVKPFDPRTKKSGTIPYAVHQLEVTQRTNYKEQRNDFTNILRKLSRLEDQVDASHRPAPVQQHQPVTQTLSPEWINALYAAATPPRNNTLAQRTQPPPPPQKPAYGNKRYFSSK